MILLLACSDQGLHPVTPDVAAPEARIEVRPTLLDFWDASHDETVVLPFTVYSVGDALLRVESLALDGSASFVLVSEETAFDLDSLASRDVEVAFAPLEAGEQLGTVTVSSNDAETPEVVVDLVGDGRVPSLLITPDPHDFGEVPIGCSETVDLTLQNVGTEDLEVSGWSHDSMPVSGDDEFTLAPWAWTTLTVEFSPEDDGVVEGTLSVVSNDPRGTVTATQTGVGLAGEQGADHFETTADPPVDVLFAVDQSASMDDDAAELGASFSSFIEAMGEVTTGWQLGVVTWDHGCLNGGVLTAATADLAATFTDAVADGTDLEIVHDEALLQLADAALEETVAGGCNEGLLRAGAPLHVVVVSDEPERSTEEASAWTWDHWLARYEAWVSDPSLLLVSGVVDTEDCNEGDDGYAEAIAATGGQALSICSGAWSDRLAALAAASVVSAWSFELSATPLEGTIGVAVNGVALGDGWSYDSVLNAVVLEDLDAGSTVDVTYDIVGTCP